MSEQKKGSETFDIWTFNARKRWLLQSPTQEVFTLFVSLPSAWHHTQEASTWKLPPQEEAGCGQGPGGNKGELREKPSWLHNSEKHQRERLQLNIPCAGKRTRIYKEYQRNEKEEHLKPRPFKREFVSTAARNSSTRVKLILILKITFEWLSRRIHMPKSKHKSSNLCVYSETQCSISLQGALGQSCI